MAKKKTAQVSSTKITQIVDHQTGNITEELSVSSYHQEKEPDFIKMYIADIARISAIPTGMEKILFDLLSQMGYNNIIPAYKPIKMMICKRLGISIDYLNKSIQTFYEKGIFIRVARGVYIADPELFARGQWADIKQLRLVIEYGVDNKGNSIKTLKSDLPEQVQLSLGFDSI